MHEQFDSRLWAEHGSQITEAMADMFHKAGDAFKTLIEIEFDAPWSREKANRSQPCAEC